jgi:hypothetical protein
MFFDPLGMVFFLSGAIYMVTTLALATGSPSFYVSVELNPPSLIEKKAATDKFKTIMFNIFLFASAGFVFILIYLVVSWQFFLFAGGFCFYLAGMKNRQITLKDAKSPRRWLFGIFPVIDIFMTRYPSGLFDLYTIGLTGLSAFILTLTIVRI